MFCALCFLFVVECIASATCSYQKVSDFSGSFPLISWKTQPSLYHGIWSVPCRSDCWVPQERHVICLGGTNCWILGMVRPGYASCGSCGERGQEGWGQGNVKIKAHSIRRWCWWFQAVIFYFKITCPCCCDLEEGKRKICLLPEL